MPNFCGKGVIYTMHDAAKGLPEVPRLPVSWPVDDGGHLVVGGIRATDLAKAYGTPLYVLDRGDIRRRMRRYQAALAPYGGTMAYAGKAFLPKAMVRVVQAEGTLLDVVSAGEFHAAVQGGMDPERMLLHGNGKSSAELAAALSGRVGRVVVDSLEELERLSDLAAALGVRPRVLLRLTPGVAAGAHHAIQTGGHDSKFGLGIEDGQAHKATAQALQSADLELVGFHCHIGSQILETRPFAEATDAMLSFARAMDREFGFWPRELDLGGGLGVRYVPTDDPPTIEEHVEATAARVQRFCEATAHAMPRVILEPGRAIVAEAGVTLYTVSDRKEVPHVRTYVAVDGGMGDNPRPALYGSQYVAVVADRVYDVAPEAVTLVGRYCESGDVLIEEAALSRPRAGDVVAVLTTGAYTHSMASTYNRVPRAAVVFVEDGRVQRAVRRETYDDLLSLDEDGPDETFPSGFVSGRDGEALPQPDPSVSD